MIDGSSRLLVLLPGYADRPEKFLARVDDLDPDGRWSVVVLEPRLDRDMGPYWYDVDEEGPVTRELDAAVAAVRDELALLVDDRSDTVVVAGFSQGGALALATLLDPEGGPTPDGVAVISGYLPVRADATIDLDRAVGLPVLFAHGDDDELVEPLRGRAAAKALQRAGAAVSWVATPGGHRFDGELLAPVRNWLDALARGETPVAPI